MEAAERMIYLVEEGEYDDRHVIAVLEGPKLAVYDAWYEYLGIEPRPVIVCPTQPTTEQVQAFKQERRAAEQLWNARRCDALEARGIGLGQHAENEPWIEWLVKECGMVRREWDVV